MRFNIWSKKIPTILGLILIVIGISVTSYLVKTGTILVGKAAPDETPKNVRISNISDTSFTVSYVTDINSIGSVILNDPNKQAITVFDDRDQQGGSVTPRRTHYITIRDLKPDTKYTFTIMSEKNNFNQENKPFETTTGPQITEAPPSQQPIVGKIVMPDGSNPPESMIYVSISGSQILSTLAKSDGSYILPLNSIRASSLVEYFNITKNTKIEMLIVNGNLQSAVKISGEQNSVPTISLSKNYDFTTGTLLQENPQASISGEINFPSFSTKPISVSKPDIITPKKDEKFLDSQPLFKGTASPGSNVKITIHSDEVQTQVIADNWGSWSYRPKSPLSPGEHTISITAQDEFGLLKTITQKFTVYAQGSQVNESATPSATPQITISPTATPTQIPNISPTTSPTMTPIPTPSPTIILSITPTTTTPLPGKTKSPGSSSVIIGGIAGMATTAVGILLFFLTRGSSSL